jgi:membrane protein
MTTTQDAAALAAKAAIRRPWDVAVRILRILGLLAKRALLDDVTTMAAALSYKTLLGLIPILVVVTLVAKTLMGASFLPTINGLIHSMGLDEMSIVPASGPAPAAGAADAAATGGTAAHASGPGAVQLGTWVESLVQEASSIDLATLGWVGVMVTIISAVWLMFSIELSFNRIYRAHRGRSIMRRLVLYWFVLTAAPLLVAAIPLLSSILNDASHLPGIGWLASLAQTLWGVFVLWVLLFLVYMIVPAAKVRASSALLGSFLAAASIIALRGVLAAYFEHAFAMSKLYGSLGLVPVFMFWLYVVWVAVLGGLEISSIAQSVGIRGLAAGDAMDDARFSDPLTLVAVMECACREWAAGRPVTAATTSVALSIDDRLAHELLEELVRARLLAHAEDGRFVPTRPPESIGADEVLAAARRTSAGEQAVPASALATRLRSAVDSAARDVPVVSGGAQGTGR